jgi:uncharacterized protein (DUF2126 family)
MGIHIALHHVTRYEYDHAVGLSPHLIRLRPAAHCRTPILSYSLKVFPEKHFINWQQDPQGNYVARVVFPEPSERLTVEVDLLADMTIVNPFDFFLEPACEQFPFVYSPSLLEELKPYLEIRETGSGLMRFLDTISLSPASTVDFLVQVNQRLQEEIHYLIRLEPGVQTCEETLTRRSGSCRDSAWLLTQVLRHLGLPARFVSGYLVQLCPDVKPLEGPEGPSHDFTDLHAWTEVYLPGAGWVGLDPTSGLFAGEGHIPLACTPNPGSAAPVSGATERCDSSFSFAMQVARIREIPRVTKPYAPERWESLLALGNTVDEALRARDVRLTMGGEPTFTSIDDMDSPEWNTEALGTQKRERAEILMRQLFGAWAPGGFLHEAQGKWYPGESLPRWALACFWRADGGVIWRDPELLGQFSPLPAAAASPETARRFCGLLADRLGVVSEHVIAGYEDIPYYLWKERRLPVNLTPQDNRLHDPEERARLTRVFEQGLQTPTGYAIPLHCALAPDGTRKWESGTWQFRSAAMYLLPGDSPMGYRLPLDSLPWLAAEQQPQVVPFDPFFPRPGLPASAQLKPAGRARPGEGLTGTSVADAGVGTGFGSGAVWGSVPRTALCAEIRAGALRVFLPPVCLLEDYLLLLETIEETAAELALPVVLEGYPPPPDARLKTFKITPDPGVIEVNTPPAASWSELVQLTETLYTFARESRLGTDKFLLDGRHSGTGGGNHLVLGGSAPAESPFVRRPDLLKSLLGFWHNHPGLSYLFSSLFIGPTSQAPRVDEGRHDALYELEIAFQQTPLQAETPPWLVDRLFRHLLTDLTGNTHRAEFCIDKLFSPDHPGGRLGLVELRSFEMPPHARMSLAQQLLVRAFVAAFWHAPYQAPLIRWGTALHDRFLLPYFVEQDLRDVLEYLNKAGFPFEPEIFRPHVEFRFPEIGSLSRNGFVLELRQAIEPWNVLGEEPGAGGTTRFVDSSVERLQVLVKGFTDTRHLVTCNQRRLPLFPTGVPGEFVAGVRYRAWQPASCLHPTIPVHAPLTFDVFDTWSARSIGGCVFHVAHPGGRNYQQFPLNAFEAESRRAARFFQTGHTPGHCGVPAPEIPNPDFPLTLDLRRGRN